MSWLSEAVRSNAFRDSLISGAKSAVMGSVPPSKVSAVQELVPFLIGLPELIKNVENTVGAGNGATKKAAVLAAFVSILKELAPWIDVLAPQYAGVIDKAIDFFVLLLNTFDNLSNKPAVPVNG